jgi:protein-S-isoprenylcysteine O-methyltransferase Ste14
MKFDWRAARAAHPRLFVVAVVLKVLRTKVGLLAAIGCVAWAFYRGRPPVDPRHPTAWFWIGIALVLAGLSFRMAALGCLKKKEELATAGVYSLCRHPLYFGSILMTYGFCFLLNVPVNFIVATVYLLLFYPLTIFWEEIRLSERYGEAHEKFSKTTPAILPLGRFRPAEFHLGLAMRKGGAILLGTTALIVVGIGVMGEVMKRH